MRPLAISRITLTRIAALCLLTLIAFQGCSDDDDDNPVEPGSQSTQLDGFFLGPFDEGGMTVTIPLAPGDLAPRLGGSALSHEVAVTGSLRRTSVDTLNLTGTYSEETDSLYVTSGFIGNLPSPYKMWGVLDPAGSFLQGHYQGPNDPGEYLLAIGGGGTVFCGDMIYDNASPAGSLNLIVMGTQVAGIFSLTEGALAQRLYRFDGSVTGTAPNQTITVNLELGEQEPVDGSVLTVAGALDATAGTITSGTWLIDLGGANPDYSGTWTGSTNCPFPPGN